MHGFLALVVACKQPVADVREPAVGTVATADAGVPSIDAAADAPALPPAPAPAAVAPSRDVIARVSAAAVSGGGMVLTIAAGAEQGVAMDWRACIVDDADRCRVGGELKLVKVEARKSSAMLEATDVEFGRRVRVKLSPP